MLNINSINNDKKIEVHLRNINKKDYNSLNTLRKMFKYSWSDFFKYMNQNKKLIENICIKGKGNSICSTKSLQTVSMLLPKWCENIAQNMPDILNSGDISRLLCKTKEEEKCHKLDKLKEVYYDTKEYEIKEISEICNIPEENLDYFIRVILTYKFNPASGSHICYDCKEYQRENKPALIISGGPSLKTYNHLSLLKKYGFEGDVFCVSKVLKDVIDAGIVPRYFGALDAEEFDTTFIDHDIVDKYSDQITGLFGINIHPTTAKRWKGKRYYFAGYIAEHDVPHLSHIFHLMTKTSNLSVSGNIGSCLYNIAAFLGYNPIIMIGMDLSFPTLKNMKEYFPLSREEDWNRTKDENGNPVRQYKQWYNPDFRKTYYTEPVYESYKISTTSWIKQMALQGLSTINCSEQGSLHGNGITSMKFEDFLKNQDNTIKETEKNSKLINKQEKSKI